MEFDVSHSQLEYLAALRVEYSQSGRPPITANEGSPSPILSGLPAGSALVKRRSQSRVRRGPQDGSDGLLRVISDKENELVRTIDRLNQLGFKHLLNSPKC